MYEIGVTVVVLLVLLGLLGAAAGDTLAERLRALARGDDERERVEQAVEAESRARSTDALLLPRRSRGARARQRGTGARPHLRRGRIEIVFVEEGRPEYGRLIRSGRLVAAVSLEGDGEAKPKRLEAR